MDFDLLFFWTGGGRRFPGNMQTVAETASHDYRMRSSSQRDRRHGACLLQGGSNRVMQITRLTNHNAIWPSAGKLTCVAQVNIGVGFAPDWLKDTVMLHWFF